MEKSILELIYGTYNPAKFNSMVEEVKELDLKLISLTQLNMDLGEAEETEDSPLGNARQKALYYYKKLKKPVFSCDSGLYFRNVSDDVQPGVKIARFNGERLTDREMMEYYMSLAKENGGKITAYYKNAICLVWDENTVFSHDESDIHSEEFYIVDKPHGDFKEGFPLNSISVHIETGKYYNDLSESSTKFLEKRGFYNFFKRVLKEKINM